MNDLVIGIVVVFLILLLVFMALGVFLKLYISKVQTHKQELYNKAIDQQKAVTQAAIETQENVLDLISNELHDDAGQQLTYINLQVERLKLEHPNLKDALEPISTSIGFLSQSVRNLSHTISHQKIKQNTLIDSFRLEINRTNKLKLVLCELIVEDEFSYTFTETERIILYRMFQEITNNMLKHSQAKHYVVEVKQTPNLQLCFRDDGKGFIQPKNTFSTNGLLNLKHRAALIGYEFCLESQPQNGTKIVLEKYA